MAMLQNTDSTLWAMHINEVTRRTTYLTIGTAIQKRVVTANVFESVARHQPTTDKRTIATLEPSP